MDQNKQLQVIENLDQSVLSIIGNKELSNFAKGFKMAEAISQLKALLTPEVMKPIMELQGNKLGFLTDKDKPGKDGKGGKGYPMEVVKNCIIEATLNGLQITGNHFNIIAGNTYPTKEGCGYKLDNMDGLDYDIVCEITAVNATKTSAKIVAHIEWTYFGTTKSKQLPIPIKIDQWTSVDAMIGKGDRKARAWLIKKITGTEVTSADVTDVESVVVKEGPIQVDHEFERAEALFKKAKNVQELDEMFVKMDNPDMGENVRDLYVEYKKKLS